MVDKITVRGMVLSQSPMGEYDKRIVLLTDTAGRISAFARGARRQGSGFMGKTEVFSFGTFTLYPGRNSYTLTGAEVENYFTGIREDLELSVYGMYFLEFASYYAREGQDETETLKLLYASLLALQKRKMAPALIRRAYELKLMTVNGEAPDVTACARCGNDAGNMYLSFKDRGVLCADCRTEGDLRLSGSALYAMRYIASQPVERLFRFTVSDEVQEQLDRVMDGYISRYTDRKLNSARMIDML
ncbi:MAG: DNA repair protein RecO [Lachnospiraceae bacterium]|nr:DNA repair protein RecO [Lachnospiraceae bacterium]